MNTNQGDAAKAHIAVPEKKEGPKNGMDQLLKSF